MCKFVYLLNLNATVQNVIEKQVISIISIYLSIFICSLTNHTAQQREKKQWNRTDKANSSYSRPKKRKSKNESRYNKY